jgi:type IV fimbrial biogenesis protein FimT
MAAMRGFTLIEIMIGLVVIGILAFIGLPEFSVMMANTQVRTAAEAITNGLQTARGEAVQRNGLVTFVMGAGSGYQVIAVSTGEIVRNRSGNEGSSTAAITITPAGATEVTFDNFGRVTTNPDATATLQKVDITSGVKAAIAAQTRAMRVEVGTNVRMCDPAVATAGDPRKCLLP